jgi:hypothetical protein
LPPDEDLVKEFSEPTYQIVEKTGLFTLEPKALVKSRIGRSTDKADAVVLTFAEPVTASGFRNKFSQNRQKMQADYDPFAGLNDGMDKGAKSNYASEHDPFRNS